MIRDWQADPNAADNSLNRCTEQYQAKSFLHCHPTPGDANDCLHGFPFRLENFMDLLAPAVPMEAAGTRVGDVGCYNRLQNPQRYAQVVPQVYQAVYEQVQQDLAGTEVASAEALDVDVELGINRNINLIQRLQEPPVLPWQTTRITQDNINDIQQYQNNILDLHVLLSDKIKWWVEVVQDSSLDKKYNRIR